jgi:predicted enzyme related to lactoylglutathione lyase
MGPMTVPENTVHYLEIVTPDVDAVRAAYERCYGWRFTPMGPELGHAFVAELPNGARCGIRAPLRASETPIVRTYVRVNDIERATETARASGATIALPPMEIPGHGTIAIYILAGVEHGMWQVR